MGTELGGVLPELRGMAESLMLDECIAGVLGAAVTDPDTGEVTTPLTPLYGTEAAPARCKVQTYEAQESRPEVGESPRTVQRYSVHIPVGSYAPAVGHVIEIVTAAMDPNLAGRRYRVVALLHKTLATAYRLAVEEA